MMKNIIRRLSAVIAVVMSVLLSSCSNTEIIDVDYPAASVYFPSAASALNEGKTAYELFELSTSSQGTHRFTIDMDNDRFVIPMSICRGGIDDSGAIDIELATDNDIVTALINEGSLGYLDDDGSVRKINFIPDAYIDCPKRLRIEDGKDIASFDIVINFEYLRERVGELFAIAVDIKSATSDVSKGLGTVTMVIDTGFMEIIPDFEIQQNEQNMLQVSMIDASNGAVSWSWDFGDGSYSQEQNPGHTYTSYGEKLVKLTITGVLGNTAEITKTVTVWEDISGWFFNGNTGCPFKPSAGNVGPPLNWSINDGVKYQEGGLKGWSDWGSWLEGMGGVGGIVQLESSNWNGPGVEDARIWCWKSLDPGNYKLVVRSEGTGVEPDAESVTDPAFLNLYYVAVKGQNLCDARTIDENADVLGKIGWNLYSTAGSEHVPPQLYEVGFSVKESSDVSVGFSANFGRHGFFRVVSVQLFRCPK